ncbi:alpha/beta fold hydrolase [Oligoflexus tunisiensis]|uniref:alpha/beta fold hydrolase n=1 Tax=Oligoflexus tunisiensis TaxID=708132 RepID=UPI00114D3795|nr:hypothetical protein [Oligoflexus tunisiensis]
MIQNLARQPILWLETGIFQYLLKPPVPMRKSSFIEGLDPQQRILYLNAVGQTYERVFQSMGESAFFPRGEITSLSRRRIVANGPMEVEELSWESRFELAWPEAESHPELKRLGFDRNLSFHDKFRQEVANRRCQARRYFKRSTTPRPVLIGLHGYAGGHFTAEELMWPIRESIDLGFDLILLVLPYHGPRIEARRRYLPPRFPSRDIRFTIEALRQIYFDVAALHDWLRGEGSVQVGLAGVSLGAYCSALIATLEKNLSCVIHVTPLGCMATLTDQQSRFIGSASEQRAQRDALEQAYACVNPLNREPLLPADGISVIGGERDGITGMSQARILARHFQCTLDTFPGGHIIRSGFRQAWVQSLQKHRSG